MGQTVQIVYGSWSEKCIDHRILYICLFTPLSSLFPYLFLPKSSEYIPSPSINIPIITLQKCSSPAFCNMSGIDSSAWLSYPITGAEAVLGGTQSWHSFLWVLREFKQGVHFSESSPLRPRVLSAIVPLWYYEFKMISLVTLWAYDSCFGPGNNLPGCYLGFPAPLWIYRRGFSTQPNIIKVQDASKIFLKANPWK